MIVYVYLQLREPYGANSWNDREATRNKYVDVRQTARSKPVVIGFHSCAARTTHRIYLAGE